MDAYPHETPAFSSHRASLGALAFALGAAALLGACGEEERPRSNGATCDTDGQCSSSSCHFKTCVDPALDDDLDGLINEIEIMAGTDPLKADTDGDGAGDWSEVGGDFRDTYNPAVLADQDQDGVIDALESFLCDTNCDGRSDQADDSTAVQTSTLTLSGTSSCVSKTCQSQYVLDDDGDGAPNGEDCDLFNGDISVADHCPPSSLVCTRMGCDTAAGTGCIPEVAEGDDCSDTSPCIEEGSCDGDGVCVPVVALDEGTPCGDSGFHYCQSAACMMGCFVEPGVDVDFHEFIKEEDYIGAALNALVEGGWFLVGDPDNFISVAGLAGDGTGPSLILDSQEALSHPSMVGVTSFDLNVRVQIENITGADEEAIYLTGAGDASPTFRVELHTQGQSTVHLAGGTVHELTWPEDASPVKVQRAARHQLRLRREETGDLRLWIDGVEVSSAAGPINAGQEAVSLDISADGWLEGGSPVLGSDGQPTGISSLLHVEAALFFATDKLACDEGSVCADSVCTPGGCTYPALPDGGVCDDGDPCSEEDGCVGGSCVGIPTSCDDGDPCTSDSCAPNDGCQHEAIPCDDGDPCTVDACDTSQGCGHTPLVCDDGDPCTVDACDDGACTHEADAGNPSCSSAWLPPGLSIIGSCTVGQTDCTFSLKEGSEALTSLQQIYRGATLYFRQPWLNSEGEVLPHQFPPTQGVTPVEGTCCSAGGLGGPDTNGNNLCDQDTSIWSTSTWSNLGFQKGSCDPPWSACGGEDSDEHAYIYSFTASGEQAQSTFVATAQRQVDCDVCREAQISVTAKLDPAWTAQTSIYGGQQICVSGCDLLAPDQLDVILTPGCGEELVVGVVELDASQKAGFLPGEGVESVHPHWLQLNAHMQAMVDGARDYYEEGDDGICPLPTTDESVPEAGTCCSANGLGGPDEDGNQLCDEDPDLWDIQPWKDMNMSIEGERAFSYKLSATELDGGLVRFVVEGSGDLDCDGVTSTFRRIGLVPTQMYSCELDDNGLDWDAIFSPYLYGMNLSE